jgi:predicted dehydrogenase
MVRVIQVGLGGWGTNWVDEVLPEVPSAEVVAFVDPSPEARERATRVHGVPTGRLFPTLAEAVRAAPAEVVLATVRTAAHHPVVMEALGLDMHVLVEKPFAVTIGEAREMVARAEQVGRILMVSQNYRYFPAPIAVAEMIAKRELGPLNLVSLDFRRHGPTQGYRYWDMPHPLLADMSIHHFDLMRMVIGADPRRLSCRSWNPGNTPFVHDPLGVATIEFKDDTVVSYRGSWISGGENTPWAGEWVMDCADGEIVWTSRNTDAGRPAGPEIVKVKCRGEPAVDAPLPNVPFIDRAGTLDAVARAVSTGTYPPFFSSGRDNLSSFAMVEAAILSAGRAGEWVDIDSLLV